MKSSNENWFEFTLIAVTMDGLGTECAEAKVSVIKINKD
tara:strand:+ start:109 stop:225 length:117 start_codon:yes stop_codon:yes gene_type:complete